MRYEAILFDLDGTLTASGEGITKSVRYALEKMGKGHMAGDLKALEVFVGPPLLNQFMSYCGFTEEEANEAVRLYRERYNVTGIFENVPYKGIEELLKELKEKGLKLAVASSKPDGMVKIVLNHFHLTEYFDVIQGSDIERPRMTKAEVIRQVLGEIGYENKKELAVMVGDRHHDVDGAKEAGLSCIGVTYGYGSQRELEEAGAYKIADSVDTLKKLLEEKQKIYDIGKELFSTPVYPGDPAPSKTPFFELSKGDDCNLTVVTLGSHNGTHLDAPKHFCKGKGGVDTIPLEKCMGNCKVAEVSGEVTARVMEELLADGTKKLLLKGELLLTPESAKVMAEKNLDLIGVESQTVGEGEGQKMVHRILLSAETVILEGLVLKEVEPGGYFLAAQPLKWEGLDGSPVRPVLLTLPF